MATATPTALSPELGVSSLSSSLADAASTLTSALLSTSYSSLPAGPSLSSFLASQSAILSSAAAASSAAVHAIAQVKGEKEEVVHPASYKVVGLVLAVASGVFIGSSFVFKKKGLIAAQKRPGFVKGEGHAYLKSPMWWTGMIIMIIGEICNFVAYAFTEAILVTPMGALSVVICAILSSIFLKETLTFFGKIGCALCVIGAVVIAMNGPSEQAAATIPAFQALFVTPWFLAYTSVVVVVCAGLILWAAPRYGKKNMLVYIAICSLIGGLSVVCTSGLGSSILTSINGDNQFKHWFMYFLMGFVVITLLTEINYLNKALELFNTAGVTTTYYVTFTFATLITDIVLNKGFKAAPAQIVSVIFGFFTICCGITLLQMSKVDPEDIAAGKSTGIPSLDRRTTLLLSASKRAAHADEDKPLREHHDSEKGEESMRDDGRNLDLEDPGVDTIRGFAGLAGSVQRALSARKTISRRKSHMSRHSHEGYSIDEEGQIVIRDGRWRNRNSRSAAERDGDGFVRHQLYDAPMPADAMDRISAYSKSPVRSEFPPDAGVNAAARKARSPTAIGFDEEVVEHRYPGVGQRGPVLHQPHTNTYPHRLPLQHTQSEMSEFGAKSSIHDGESIIDAYTPATPRPPPAHRATDASSSYDLGRTNTSTSGGSASGSTATGGSVVRGENRSLSQMLTDHFAQHTPSLAIDTSAQDPARERQLSAGSRSGTARGIFDSIRGRPSPDPAQEAEERMGLVGHGAHFAGSAAGHQVRSDSRASNQSGSGSSDTESLDGGRVESRFRDENGQDDSYPRRKL